jgi:hypothetical protein
MHIRESETVFFKNIFTFTMVAMLLFLLSVLSGCSREDTKVNKGISLNEPRKRGSTDKFQTSSERQETHVPYEMSPDERKKYMRTAQQCQDRFEKCVERCSSGVCEEGCLHDLSSCEKGLPKELQSLKQD